MNGIGHNDENCVYCHLCDWKKPVQSFEQAEHFLKQHVKEVHGIIMRYAVEDDTGIRKDTP